MFCGIDFGTSNSAVAAGRNVGDVTLVPLENGAVTIPSAVFFNHEEGRTRFGRAGITEYRDGYDGRLMRALKSILGSELIGESTLLGRRRMDFRAIIGLFLSHIKSQAETHLGEGLTDVVLGRPVRFVDDDDAADARAEQELRSIAQAQGFTNILFEYEPLAAARDYERTLEKEEVVLVVDIGGGTSDFSVLRLTRETQTADDRRRNILANAGVHIGGTNFDQRLSLETVMPDLGYGTKLKTGLDMPLAPYQGFTTWHLINTLYMERSVANVRDLMIAAEHRDRLERFMAVIREKAGHEIAARVEAAKIDLSVSTDTTVPLDDIVPGWHVNAARQDLMRATGDYFTRIVRKAEDTVEKLAGLSRSKVDSVFMTGGSTGLPGFENRIQAAFPDARLRYGDRFSSVASGLGLAAAEHFGQGN